MQRSTYSTMWHSTIFFVCCSVGSSWWCPLRRMAWMCSRFTTTRTLRTRLCLLQTLSSTLRRDCKTARGGAWWWCDRPQRQHPHPDSLCLFGERDLHILHGWLNTRTTLTLTVLYASLGTRMHTHTYTNKHTNKRHTHAGQAWHTKKMRM